MTRTPFGLADELSCYYDSPAEPCNVHIEVRVPGHLEEPGLRRAVHAALAAQPRAVARRAPGGRWQRRYAWELPARLDTDPVTTATWTDERDLAQQRMRFLAASPPLDQSPPLRLLLAAGPGEDRVILNAHHAALDGISCLELLRAVAAHYPAAGGHRRTGPAGRRHARRADPGRRAGPGPAGRPRFHRAPGSGGDPISGPFHDPTETPVRRRIRPGGRRLAAADPGRRPGVLPRPATRIAADRRAGPGRGRAWAPVRLRVPADHLAARARAPPAGREPGSRSTTC